MFLDRMTKLESQYPRLVSVEDSMETAEAFGRFEQQAIYRDKRNRTFLWEKYAQDNPSVLPHTFLNAAASELEQKPIPKVVVDLGAGSSPNAIPLLRRGWKVIAVDSSQGALDALRNRVTYYNPSLLPNLSLVCKTIEDYELPKEVSLIIADGIFPYLNPKNLQPIWNKIYRSLSSQGYLLGNFFFNARSLQYRAITNETFIDLSTFKTLLKRFYPWHSYKWQNANKIDFLGSKDPSKAVQSLIKIRLSSHYENAKNYPYKSIVPYIFSYAVDSLAVLREVSKLSFFATLPLVAFQSLRKRQIVSSKLFIANLAAWLIFKSAVFLLEPKIKKYLINQQKREWNSTQTAIQEQIKRVQSKGGPWLNYLK